MINETIAQIDWIKNFTIPIIELTLLIGIWGFLSFIIGRTLIRYWNKTFKYILKYKIFKRKVQDFSAIKDIEDDKLMKELLLAGYLKKNIYELIYIKNNIRRNKND